MPDKHCYILSFAGAPRSLGPAHERARRLAGVMRARGMRAAVYLALSGATLAACAGAPAPRLDAGDRRIIAEVTQQALEANETGEGANWANPATGRRGTVTPIRTFRRAGVACREFQQTATIEERTMIAYDVACRRDDGVWRSRNYAGLAGAIADAPYYRDRRYYDPRYDRYPYYPHYPFGFGYPYGPHGRFWYSY